MLQQYDQKNIRRRVYDALNVLMAMNIISKDKKEIRWIGLPTNSAQECQNLEVRYRPTPRRTEGFVIPIPTGDVVVCLSVCVISVPPSETLIYCLQGCLLQWAFPIFRDIQFHVLLNYFDYGGESSGLTVKNKHTLCSIKCKAFVDHLQHDYCQGHYVFAW